MASREIYHGRTNGEGGNRINMANLRKTLLKIIPNVCTLGLGLSVAYITSLGTRVNLDGQRYFVSSTNNKTTVTSFFDNPISDLNGDGKADVVYIPSPIRFDTETMEPNNHQRGLFERVYKAYQAGGQK